MAEVPFPPSAADDALVLLLSDVGLTPGVHLELNLTLSPEGGAAWLPLWP